MKTSRLIKMPTFINEVFKTNISVVFIFEKLYKIFIHILRKLQNLKMRTSRFFLLVFFLKTRGVSILELLYPERCMPRVGIILYGDPACRGSNFVSFYLISHYKLISAVLVPKYFLPCGGSYCDPPYGVPFESLDIYIFP